MLLVERLVGGDVAVGVGEVELEVVVADARLQCGGDRDTGAMSALSQTLMT